MATPLEAYFEMIERRGSACPFSACWRGYIATWRPDEDRLYLVHLKPAMNDGDQLKVRTLFPGQESEYSHRGSHAAYEFLKAGASFQ